MAKQKTFFKTLLLMLPLAAAVALTVGVIHAGLTDSQVDETAKIPETSDEEVPTPVIPPKPDVEDKPVPVAEDGRSVATVVISPIPAVVDGANPVRISGEITNLFEDGDSTCTYVLTAPSGTTEVIESAGVPNFSDTACTPIEKQLDERGTWSVVLTYDSEQSHGVSEMVEFELK